jgi:ferritin
MYRTGTSLSKLNTNVSISSNSEMAEYINEQLAMETVADRQVTRIHETSMPDFKQHLEQNLQETMTHQERMYQLITNLVGKPTDSKADLPHLNQSYRNPIEELKSTVQSLRIDHDKESTK